MIDQAEALRQIRQLSHAAQALERLLTVAPEPPARLRVLAGQSIQAAIDTAPIGAAIELEPATYEGSLVLRQPVRLHAPVVPLKRVSPATPSGVTIVGQAGTDAIRIEGPQGQLAGLSVRSADPTATLVNLAGGSQTLIDACHLLGDPEKGQRRGIACNGPATFIRRCYVDHIFTTGGEAQAVLGWKSCAGSRIDDCTLLASSQSVMWGGVDAPSEADQPREVVVSRSLLSKRREWYAKMSAGVWTKCAYECKNVVGARLEDSILEFSGMSGGQKGYLIVLTPRNQGGNNPWACVRQVEIERCVGRYSGGGINLLGSDDLKPSGPLEEVLIRQVRFTDLDPKGVWKGEGRGFVLNRAPRNVVFDSVTFAGKNGNAVGYLIHATAPPPVGLVLRNVLNNGGFDYGLKLDAGGAGTDALLAWAPDAILDDADLSGATEASR